MQILRTGFVGLNAITGSYEGLPIGTSSLWMGLPNNYTAGLLYSVVAGAILANEPPDDEQYAAILVTSEVTIEILADLFQRQFHHQSSQATGLGYVDPFPEFEDEVPLDLKLEYIETVAMELGWVIKFVTPKRGEFDEDVLRAEIDQLVHKATQDEEKLVVKLVAIQDLDSCRIDNERPRYRARGLRNLAHERGFHLAVTDQLSSEVAELRKAVQGPLTLLNTLRGKGYSSTNFLEAEFDQVFHVHLEKGEDGAEDRVYMSVDKNRGPGIPKRACICAYPLEDGFLSFDVTRGPSYDYEEEGDSP